MSENQNEIRHIKILVEKCDEKQYVRIAEQTHRGMDFGIGEEAGTRRFTASNGFVLLSLSNPEARERKEEKYSCLYVRGLFDCSDNDLLPAPSPEWLDKLRVAIAEYNYQGGAKPKIIEIIE